MPIYEYACRACVKSFEHLHRRMDEPAPACPFCGAKKPAKQFSAFAPKIGAGKPVMPPCATGGGCSGKCPSARACGL